MGYEKLALFGHFVASIAPLLGWFADCLRRREKSRRGTLKARATTGLDVATNGDTARKNACATKAKGRGSQNGDPRYRPATND